MGLTQNYKLNTIQWYPGHIAKAEKNLKEQLKLVDVVLEVRDARIPLATNHPEIPEWIGNKARILVLNRLDMITPEVRRLWTDWFKRQGEVAYFTNAKLGDGVATLLKAAQSAGVAVNERRKSRGMLPRPVRAVVIGFPNVGKSALINRLLKKKVVESAARPGVTRQLRWVRISPEVELLDAPGVIPLKLSDQEAALKLAICDDIGDASYDNQLVAAALINLLNYLSDVHSEFLPEKILESRYGVDPAPHEGDEYLHLVAAHRNLGDVEKTARQFITDYRKGYLGTIPLEFPPN